MAVTIQTNIETEIVEKKSKFIATLFYISSKEEAEKKLEEVRKRYHDARHHCYAFRIEQKDQIIERASDDGEPSGTAGSPMLQLLGKKNLVNVLIIVTRYFGGILLGTGGLIRAYTEVAQKALEQAIFIEEEFGYEVNVQCSYSEIEKIQYYCKNQNISIIGSDFGEKVNFLLEMTNQEEKELQKKLQISEQAPFKIETYRIVKEKKIRKKQ